MYVIENGVATVVDHLLTDLQSQADAIVAGERTLWERSPELLTRGIVTFVTALNPIQQAKDIGSLIEDLRIFGWQGIVCNSRCDT